MSRDAARTPAKRYAGQVAAGEDPAADRAEAKAAADNTFEATRPVSRRKPSCAHSAQCGGLDFIGFSIDEATGAAGIDWNVNGVATTDTSTYTSPSASNATHTMQVGAGGNNGTPLLSGAGTARWRCGA